MGTVEGWTDEQLDLAIQGAYIPRILGQVNVEREAFVALRQARTRIAELEAESAELRKQNEILATTRRLEEGARKQAEAENSNLREADREADRVLLAWVSRAEKAEAERDTRRDLAEQWHWCATHTANDSGEVRGRWVGTTLMYYLFTIGRRNP